MSQVEQFGKYLLLEKVAAGGMAEVYLAKSTGATGLNKFFAIKRILPQFTSNEDFISMFKEEANVAINLNHSNIVSIFDFGIEKLQFYLVMDFVEGRNLRQIINELKKNNKSFSIDQALYIVKETAAGLDHAHRCTDSKTGRPLNITHRDMSPQNIMVSFEGEVKVIDFGIAKAETEQEETKAGTLKGKFGYMSPEQAEGVAIDPRTDVFALGIVLWELLANDRLFTGSNETAILRKVRDCQIPSIRKVNPTVSPELERIVMKALAKDRNVRYQTAANFHRDLNRYLNTQFPDFSPQDFSQFIKESFRAAYQEGKEKLVYYSQIEAPKPLPNEETLTLTAAPPLPSNRAPEPPRELPKVPEDDSEKAPEGFAADPDFKTLLHGVLDANMDASEKRKRRMQNITKMQNMNTLQKQTAQKFNKTSITNINKTRITQVSHHNSSSSVDFGTILAKGFFMAALIYGGFWSYKNMSRFFNFEPIINTPPVHVVTKTPACPPEGCVTDSSSIALAKVSVSSSPTGAAIFKDGVDTKYITPAIITVDANKSVSFTLKKDGYLEYETTQKFDQVGQLTATLQPTSRAGYLNIYLSNGGPNTKIYVNGKELSEAIPVMKYPVVAENEAIIRAFNPITKLSDEIHVKLHAGESKNVELILGRTSDINAGKK